MNWGDAFSEINWVAVILATMSSFAVGFIWYDKRTFGSKWQKLVGLTDKQMSNPEGMGMTFAMTAIAGLLGNVVLNMLMFTTNTTGIVNGLVFGAIVGFTVRGAAHVIHNGFAQRPKDLTTIDMLHDTAAVALAGAIIGAFL